MHVVLVLIYFPMSIRFGALDTRLAGGTAGRSNHKCTRTALLHDRPARLAELCDRTVSYAFENALRNSAENTLRVVVCML